ncbi:hypothetical protein HPB51_003985 [Rhipicephalus microplus]|uniref:Uncharacterized protein n=1 Tax=Rhipicephalus microplus TaxID=6941 RepID=A0A9J6DSF1_RHIMP|nr:hypothetical protein HPB51_003985 [Rhipicephalus microplus]
MGKLCHGTAQEPVILRRQSAYLLIFEGSEDATEACQPGEEQLALKHTSWVKMCPKRSVSIDHQLGAGVVRIEVTDRYRAMADVLSKPIGHFQANRFFEFPAMLDTKAISQLVEAVRSSAWAQSDEAVFLRCMLLSEVIVSSDKMKRMTHVAARYATDTFITTIERHVGIYGAATPSGAVAAVDLTFFAALMTRKALYPRRSKFGVDTWGSQTAIVPIKMEHSGSRAVLPYVLSFLTTRYWSQRVGYNVTVQEIGATAPRTFQIDCLPRAGQALIGGPENLLLVVIDIEVHPGNSVRFALGGGGSVEVLGKSARAAPASDHNIRDTVVDAWMGGGN